MSALSLSELRGMGRRPDVVVLGIGNRLRGDDAAGVLVAEECMRRGMAGVDCGDVPENHLADVARREPRVVILADAADFGGRPGDAAVFEADELGGRGVATHGMPISLIADHLAALCGARVLLLAVQPKALGFGLALSPEVAAAAARAADVLAGLTPPARVEVTS